MALTMQEVCIFHLYQVTPSEMVTFMNRWNLTTACEYHRGLSRGNAQEQAAAAALSALDVYQIMQDFMTRKGHGADEDVMGAYLMDQEMYEKLRYYLHGDIHYEEAIA